MVFRTHTLNPLRSTGSTGGLWKGSLHSHPIWNVVYIFSSKLLPGTDSGLCNLLDFILSSFSRNSLIWKSVIQNVNWVSYDSVGWLRHLGRKIRQQHLKEENADHLPHQRPLPVVRVCTAQARHHEPLHLLPVEVQAQPLICRLNNSVLPVEIPYPVNETNSSLFIVRQVKIPWFFTQEDDPKALCFSFFQLMNKWKFWLLVLYKWSWSI